MTDHAALYLLETPPSVDWIESQSGVESCDILQDDADFPSQYQIQFLGRSLTINVMSSDELPKHIAGFSNYIMQLHQKRPCEHTVTTLEKIAKTQTALGCVIEPGLDEEGYVGGFLTSIIHRYGGLIFARDSIFDSDGHPIIGTLAKTFSH